MDKYLLNMNLYIRAEYIHEEDKLNEYGTRIDESLPTPPGGLCLMWPVGHSSRERLERTSEKGLSPTYRRMCLWTILSFPR